MSGLETFERQLKVATAGLSPEAISRELAAFAKAERDELVRTGQASPSYRRFVNGREGVAEESVRAPGPILYVFNNWNVVIEAALAELSKRVRSKSGRYASSFIVIVAGRVVTDFSAIAHDAEVIIINHQPYTRKLDNSRDSNRRHFLWAYHALRRRFGQTATSSGPFDIRHVYLNVGSGVHPSVPYLLKTGGRVRAAAQNARSLAFREGRATLAPRRGTQAGEPITYPALVINAL